MDLYPQMSKYKILVLILLFSAVLRFYKVTELSLYGDELTIAYDAYSILKTGKDQFGELLPLTFSSGAGRPAGYVYFSIPFVYLFGPTALGVRFLSILSSLGIIAITYLFVKEFISEKVAIISAAFSSISLWSLSLSRGGYEAHFALFLSLLGLYSLLKSQKNIKYLYIWAISWGLAIHTYPVYKLTLPILLIVIFVVYKKEVTKLVSKYKLEVIFSIFILLIAGILSVHQTLFAGSEERFLNQNIFSNQALNNRIVEKVNYERISNNLPEFIDPLFHNRVIEYSMVFLRSYLSNFSIGFLFTEGDNNPRHNMTSMGEFYWVEIITIFLGIYLMFKKRNKLSILIFSWILITPIATAFMLDQHALRNSFMFPAITILSSLGFYYLSKNYRLIGYFAVFLLISQLILALARFYFVEPVIQSKFWAKHAEIATVYANENKGNYDRIILSSSIESIIPAYRVYSEIDPVVVINKDDLSVINGHEFLQYGNVYIGSTPRSEINVFLENQPSNTLYIGQINEKDYVTNYNSIIYSIDNEPAMIVTEIN